MIIKATDGTEFKVDVEDYQFLNRHNWINKRGYAVTVINNKNIYMHRLIFGSVPSGMVVDHINRDKSDNRKENLRAASHLENHYNIDYGTSKGYVGIKKKQNRFIAKASVNNKEVYIGSAKTEVEAARLRDAFVYQLRGEFAFLNFPDDKPLYAVWELPERLKRHLE